MTNDEIKDTFEAYFEKYKKTEGDRQSWSAPWTSYGPKGLFQITMTKCPEGTIFKPFTDNAKLDEIKGWDAFLGTLDALESEHEGKFDRELFFSEMKDMI